ncbi:hypothetical protein [Paenibacillus endoradicis]|uniref:hypothetical protein n=1 Tax=Paenibacillus endoradicis TaxID=2972487 RepID=UPI002158ABCC|nr:hypothetical protein [Paenibacillus endoradicis]MCR8656921.1 hypothetical protein [Paenibacillus endoradicis]
MITMYPAIANSPITEVSTAITASQTSITLLNGAVLPAAPNLAVIGQGENAETILYTSKSGNTISGVTRGLQGSAQSWAIGTKVARNYTAYDHEAFRQNIMDSLPKENPVATGMFNLDQRIFEKYLGTKLTIGNSPKQKMNIEFPVAYFNGYLDVTVSGGFNTIDISGNLTKRFYGTLTVNGSNTFSDEKYIEASSRTIPHIRIGSLRFDSEKSKFIIPIEFATNTNPDQRVSVKVTAFNSTQNVPADFETAMKAMTLTEFYADSTALPAPQVRVDSVHFAAAQGTPSATSISTTVMPNWNSGLHNGWKRYNAFSELGITQGSETFDAIFNAMEPLSILVVYTSSTVGGLYPAAGHLIVEKLGTTVAWFYFLENTPNEFTLKSRYNSTATIKFGGWKREPYANGSVQTSLNAELHNGWRNYNALTEVAAANANLATIIAAMADKSIMRFNVNADNNVNIGLAATDYGIIEIRKWTINRVTVILDNMYTGKLMHNPINTSGVPTSWKLHPVSDGTLQANLNAERTNGIKTYNSLTTPVGATNGDLWFPPPS